uniref:Lipoprotein n=1 Tax=Roseihalotalea indica TaxID=2867963 RepID=A0AA49GSU2_9BACT|nr:hypothetical protein K4G66_03795 [Tunicatimonas sp. TK19036]
MNKAGLVLIVFLIVIVSCGKNPNYTPQGLRKLSDTELIERARARNHLSENIVFKDSMGNIILRDELRKINREESFGD